MSNLFNYDVLSYVMEHVDSDTLRCCLLVSHEWNAAASYEDLWKKAFISRWPLMMRLQNVYSPSWRLAFASQTRREHDIATIFSEHNLLPSKHIPADPEYKGIANGAPAEPLQDSFRLACITENDESQKVFRRIATVFRGVQIVTQSGKQESYVSKDGEWGRTQRAYLPAICWLARAGRPVDSEEGYWQIRRSLSLEGWIFKYIDRRKPASTATETDLAVYNLERTIGPWARNNPTGNPASMRSIDFNDQALNRASFALFSQWLCAVDQGASVEYFSDLLDVEKSDPESKFIALKPKDTLSTQPVPTPPLLQ